MIEVVNSEFTDTGHGGEYFYTLSRGYIRVEVVPQMNLTHADVDTPDIKTIRQTRHIIREHLVPFFSEEYGFDCTYVVAPTDKVLRFAKVIFNNKLNFVGDISVGPLYQIMFGDI